MNEKSGWNCFQPPCVFRLSTQTALNFLAAASRLHETEEGVASSMSDEHLPLPVSV